MTSKTVRSVRSFMVKPCSRVAIIPIAAFLFLSVFAPLSGASPAATISLDEALREARRANASLPLAAIDTLAAEAGLREARGRPWPRFALDGDVHEGTPSKYASGDARLQLVADLPLYSGGELRAGVNTARAERDLTAAFYRMAVADLDLEVRVRYAEILRLERERELARHGRQRLERYLDLIEARKGSGDPVAADLLKATVRLAEAAADLVELERQLAGSRLDMNEILGRDPADSLVFAPLPDPQAPEPGAGRPWESAPDLRASELAHRRELARIGEVKAGRRPRLDLSANVGTEPVIGPDNLAPLNTGEGTGAEVTLSFTWPLWDNGVYRGQLQQAELGVRRAEQETEASRRRLRLDWNRARADMEHFYRIVATWNHAVPLAEEAYLQAESLYRGGDASALDVLDAFDQWTQAGRNAAQAVFAYREAEARALRWGTP